MSIVLRAASPPDAEALASLLRRSRALLDFLPVLHTPEEDLWFMRHELFAKQQIVVAEHDGKLAGFLAQDGACVTQLYLDPSARRLGVGSALLADAQSRTDHLWLWCFAQNAPARAFYERHGFVAEQFTDGAHNEERQPDVLYRWVRSPAG